MARDRKRAKQRRSRRGPARGTAAERAREGAAVPPSKPIRSDLPGSLDHASAEVDEFDAALLRGSEGEAADTDRVTAGADGAAAEPAEPESLSELEIESEAEAEGDLGEDEIEELARPGGRRATPEQASGAPVRGGNRVLAFLRASWAELQRVQWPDRRQVVQATAVVLGFVAVAGAYLGLADVVAKEIVEFVL